MPSAALRPRPQLRETARIKSQGTVEGCIRDKLFACPYAYYLNRVFWSFENGTLTLQGLVPTFYMKQVLQSQLREIEGVVRIENEVDVANASGFLDVPSPPIVESTPITTNSH